MRQFLQRVAGLAFVPHAALDQREIGEALLGRIGHQVDLDAVRERGPADLPGDPEGRKILPRHHKYSEQQAG